MYFKLLMVLVAVAALQTCIKSQEEAWIPDDYACNDAIGYMTYASYCRYNFTNLMQLYLLGLDENMADYGSGFGSGLLPDYFYDDGNGWDLTDWDSHICTTSMDRFDTCMRQLINPDCDALSSYIDGYIDNYRNQYCDGSELRERFKRLKGALTQESQIAVWAGLTCASVDQIFQILGGDCYFDYSTSWSSNQQQSFEERRSTIESEFRGSFACALSDLTDDDCSSEELALFEPLVFQMYLYTHVPGIDVSFEDVFTGFDPSSVDPNARKRSTVAVFGDPHLYVFGANMEAGKMMTCLSPGNTVYIKNRFLEINGVNTPVNENDPQSATYMTSVSITIKNKNKEIIATYSAETDLPSDFEQYSGEPGDVEISMSDTGLVLIKSKQAGIAISVGRFAHTYQLVLRMSDSLFLSSTGLLYSGCTGNDIITRVIEPQRRRRNAVCEGVDETAREACEFDFQQTGNETLAVGATASLPAMTEEAEAQDEELIIENETDGADSVKGTTMYIALTLASFIMYI